MVPLPERGTEAEHAGEHALASSSEEQPGGFRGEACGVGRPRNGREVCNAKRAAGLAGCVARAGGQARCLRCRFQGRCDNRRGDYPEAGAPQGEEEGQRDIAARL